MQKSSAGEMKGKAWALFLKAYATLVHKVEAAFAAARLPPLTWYDVLWELEKADDGRLRMHELALQVVITRSNLTRLLDRLESAGLIVREPCPDDRRGAFAVISTAGRAMRRKMWPVYNGQIAALFANHVTDSEARQLVATFRKLITDADATPS